MTNSNYHIMCSCQLHTPGIVSEKQIESVSQSLSASANKLRKMVEGVKDNSNNPPEYKYTGEKSTFAVHGDASYADILAGLTRYDSSNVDTPDYKIKSDTYNEVAQKYPQGNFDKMLRDEKVQALKELSAVGFKYYSIRVTVFVEKDGLTQPVYSKAHHRLQKPSVDYLKEVLTTYFKAVIRPDSDKEPKSDDSIDTTETNVSQ